jgi:DNA-binding PadR family transcriptional regulator
MPKINKTKYALLGLLSLGPMSGYDIKKFTDISISYFWNENFGHIYPVLKKMEEDGLVTKRVEATEGRPNRNVYSITDSGRDELEKWLSVSPEEHSLRSELLLKIFFGALTSRETIIDMIRGEKERHEKRREALSSIEEMIVANKGDRFEGDRPFWLLTLSYGKKMSLSVTEWCDEAIKILTDL